MKKEYLNGILVNLGKKNEGSAQWEYTCELCSPQKAFFITDCEANLGQNNEIYANVDQVTLACNCTTLSKEGSTSRIQPHFAAFTLSVLKEIFILFKKASELLPLISGVSLVLLAQESLSKSLRSFLLSMILDGMGRAGIKKKRYLEQYRKDSLSLRSSIRCAISNQMSSTKSTIMIAQCQV